MSSAEASGPGGQPVIRLYHGTDLAGANDLLINGVNQATAAVWNGSGEFWVTTDPGRANWFALSHPNSPPAARFEFDLPEQMLQALLTAVPPVAAQHGVTDYELFPASFAQLNAAMQNQQVVQVP
jgi:hypothetical protein